MDYKEHLSNCDESQELLSLMEQKLPEYVTKCFLASGFDSEEAIACIWMWLLMDQEILLK